MKRYAWLILGSIVLIAGCHNDMWVQSKVKPQSRSQFFTDSRGSRIEPKGTISAGQETNDVEYLTGYTPEGRLVKEFPIIVDRDLLERGHDRFKIFCTPCHGQLGDGNGMIAQRGFKVAQPPGNYHTDRLREMPVGHFFDVMTNGYGAMFPFSGRVPVEDRWAIAAYIRVLQKSQNMPVTELTPSDMEKLTAPAPTEGEAEAPHGEAGH
jgi:mono/diheme cytochrome c family protein